MLPANVIAIPRLLSYRAPAPAVPVAVLESDTYGYAYGTGKVRVPRWRALVPRVNGQELRVSRAQCIWLVAVTTATKKALWPMAMAHGPWPMNLRTKQLGIMHSIASVTTLHPVDTPESNTTHVFFELQMATNGYKWNAD